LSATLAPLTSAGADLEVVKVYGLASDQSKAAIEVYPIVGKKITAVAKAAGLSAVPTPVAKESTDSSPPLAASPA